MRRIKKMVHCMVDELESAECYAEKYIEHRADGNTNTAARFKIMAQEELEHASTMHEIAKVEVERISAIVTPPECMMKKWEDNHECYVEKAEYIKKLLNA